MFELINDDCLSVIAGIPDSSIDLVITDPPYNIGSDDKRTKVGNKIVSNKEAWGKWDSYEEDEYNEFIFFVLQEIYRILSDGGALYFFTAREKNGYFCEYATKQIGFNYQNTIAIVKQNPIPQFSKRNYRSAFELAFYVSKGKLKTFNFLGQGTMVNAHQYIIGSLKQSSHPTEKPLSIIKILVNVSSNEGDLVFDPFSGSGTTGVASVIYERDFLGVEIDEEYYKESYQRINNALQGTKQETLFYG